MTDATNTVPISSSSVSQEQVSFAPVKFAATVEHKSDDELLEVIDLTGSARPLPTQSKTVANTETTSGRQVTVVDTTAASTATTSADTPNVTFEFPYDEVCALEAVVPPLNWMVTSQTPLYLLRFKAVMRILNVMQVAFPDFNLRDYSLQIAAAQKIELILLQDLRMRMKRGSSSSVEIAKDPTNYLTATNYHLFSRIPTRFDIEGNELQKEKG
jgi:hypothetical protein